MCEMLNRQDVKCIRNHGLQRSAGIQIARNMPLIWELSPTSGDSDAQGVSPKKTKMGLALTQDPGGDLPAGPSTFGCKKSCWLPDNYEPVSVLKNDYLLPHSQQKKAGGVDDALSGQRLHY